MRNEKSLGIKVKLTQAEETRIFLSNNNILRRDLKFIKDNSFIYFPIIKKSYKIKDFEIIEKYFEVKEKKPKSYKNIASVPLNLKKDLPTSYDVIGDILLIKLPENLLRYKDEIGNSLIKLKKNIKVVCLNKPISGELRTRNVEIISGENRLETIHKEYGLFFNVNVKKTYFSPRLASE